MRGLPREKILLRATVLPRAGTNEKESVPEHWVSAEKGCFANSDASGGIAMGGGSATFVLTESDY